MEEVLGDKICVLLKRIEQECVTKLHLCFSGEDIHRMTESHLQEMRLFLSRVVQARLSVQQLEECHLNVSQENETEDSHLKSVDENIDPGKDIIVVDGISDKDNNTQSVLIPENIEQKDKRSNTARLSDAKSEKLSYPSSSASYSS